MTGTEKTIWVRIISHTPEPTRLKPLDPHRRRTERPKEEVGIINGILSIVRIKSPNRLLLIMNDKGIAMHIAMKVAVKATIMEVIVASSMEPK